MSCLIPGLVAFKCILEEKVQVLTLVGVPWASLIFYDLLIFSSAFWKFFLNFFFGGEGSFKGNKEMSRISHVVWSCFFSFLCCFLFFCFVFVLSFPATVSCTRITVPRTLRGHPFWACVTPLPWSGHSCLFCRNGAVILMFLKEIASLLTKASCWAVCSAFFPWLLWPLALLQIPPAASTVPLWVGWCLSLCLSS